MRAIYHPEYKTAQELDDAIARLEQVMTMPIRVSNRMSLSWYRDDLLYDLANRRDTGEIKRLTP